jgi:hypothetical protein
MVKKITLSAEELAAEEHMYPPYLLAEEKRAESGHRLPEELLELPDTYCSRY